MTDPAPFRSGPYSMEEIEREAPDMHEAIVYAYDEAGSFDSLEDFVDCERFWDAVRCMEDFGVDVSTVHAGSVLCRECGRPVSSVSRHSCEEDVGVSEYRKKHPTAPATLDERALLPPADIDWR